MSGSLFVPLVNRMIDINRYAKARANKSAQFRRLDDFENADKRARGDIISIVIGCSG
jgi:hypothetical protein